MCGKLFVMSTSPPASLRERKKQRTRQALIDTALAKFTEQGFDGTTLDELCEAVEVSKTTFFRYFGGKEDVALAPVEDMWTAFVADLGSREPGSRSLVEVLQESLLSALSGMPGEDWAQRLLLSRRIAAGMPSIDAHGKHFCERTTNEAVDVLRARFGLSDQVDLRARLAMDLVIAAFHRALELWLQRADSHTRDELADCVREVFAAVPGVLEVSVDSA
ncbi:DNA-binding transcriptional regulator, AcrR family [Saccharopolyspora antimicrobica]|uniref:DNA-binding transcriptional regulator, AcrR family n=2 Tax=Saccharopolyspora antimicrobica TaxID=455193 RepID=A0A1I5G3B5_9PSEU|nr:TetR family transcriptional regulator [Saccharopolyspora antimicrobica]SFO30498.1 DNA-binding transcriptional regulator, AcrR family [Saccharopolyspora antimicrobica]